MIIHSVDQNSEEWFELRSGIPTASEFSRLVTSTGARSKQLDKYALTLAAEKFAGEPVDRWQGNAHTERGHELEDEAIKTFEFLNDVSVERVGFVTNDEKTIGCSPDGFVSDDSLVEIKCLKADNHIEALMYCKQYKKVPSKYVQQTQGQMLLCEKSLNNVFFYHPKLPCFSVPCVPSERFLEDLHVSFDELFSLRDAALAALNSL